MDAEVVFFFKIYVGSVRAKQVKFGEYTYIAFWLGALICITISQLVQAKMQILNEIRREVASGIESLAE